MFLLTEVEVETDCSSELAPREERWLAMERASQQGRAKGFIGPDDLARSLTNRRRFRGEQIYIILDSYRGLRPRSSLRSRLRFYSSILDVTWELADSRPV